MRVTASLGARAIREICFLRRAGSRMLDV